MSQPFAFPYGFPSSFSRQLAGTDLLWPRCVNAESGTYGHECGQPARYIGLSGDRAATFCAFCRMHGHDAAKVQTWHSLPAFPTDESGQPALSFKMTR